MADSQCQVNSKITVKASTTLSLTSLVKLSVVETANIITRYLKIDLTPAICIQLKVTGYQI